MAPARMAPAGMVKRIPFVCFSFAETRLHQFRHCYSHVKLYQSPDTRRASVQVFTSYQKNMSSSQSRQENKRMKTYKCHLTEDALYHVFMRELHSYYETYVCLRESSDGDKEWWTGEVERTREAVFAWLTEHPWLADRYDEECVFVVGENVFSRGVRLLMIAAYYQDVAVIERASRERWVTSTQQMLSTRRHCTTHWFLRLRGTVFLLRVAEVADLSLVS
jgi:hypothetical protein